MESIYRELNCAIQTWRNAFSSGYALYEDIDNSSTTELVIVREYENKQVYWLSGSERLIYYYFYSPHSLHQATMELELSEPILRMVLDKNVNDKIMIHLDGKYLSLATRNSQYRWQKFKVLPNNG